VFGLPSLGPAGLPLLPSCALIGVGMVVGAPIRRGDLRAFLRTCGAVIACAILIRLAHVISSAPTAFPAYFLTMEGRGSFPYFVWGAAAGAALLAMCRACEPLLKKWPILAGAVALPGRFPLLAFGGGNIVLNLWPDRFRTSDYSTLNVALFLAALTMMLLAADWLSRARRADTQLSAPQMIGG
jgi:hypothetical protein